jgi:hypothetical protein
MAVRDKRFVIRQMIPEPGETRHSHRHIWFRDLRVSLATNCVCSAFNSLSRDSSRERSHVTGHRPQIDRSTSEQAPRLRTESSTGAHNPDNRPHFHLFRNLSCHRTRRSSTECKYIPKRSRSPLLPMYRACFPCSDKYLPSGHR